MWDHWGCGLNERTMQAIKKSFGVMLLDDNVTYIQTCLSTIMRDFSWSGTKIIQHSTFEAYFGRLTKTEFTIILDNFLINSDHLDKKHLEWKAFTTSQFKKRIDQLRDNEKIVRKGQNSRDVSPSRYWEKKWLDSCFKKAHQSWHQGYGGKRGIEFGTKRAKPK